MVYQPNQHFTRFLIISTITLTIIVIFHKINSRNVTIDYYNDTKHEEPQRDYRNELIKSLPSWDYGRLVDLTSFSYSIFNSVCYNGMLFIVLIHSKPSNFEKRMSIRNSWGHSAMGNVKILFFLGLQEKMNNQTRISEENARYLDIIQGNYIDAYYNLTYKHASALKYLVYHCPQAQFGLKIDDDTFLNIPAVEKFFGDILRRCGNQNVLHCPFPGALNVLRGGKWGVNTNEMPLSDYPMHCYGYFVGYHWHAAYNIYREAQRGDFYKLDDVYFTGLLARRSGTTHLNIRPYAAGVDSVLAYGTSNGTKGKVNFLVSSPNVNVNTVGALWEVIKDIPKENRTVNISKDYCA